MTIQVISVGKKEVNCGKCKSQLTYSQNDVKSYKTNYDYTGDYDIVDGIQCPVCENVIKDK